MNRTVRMISRALVMALVLLVATSTTLLAQTETRIRFTHLVPGAPAIDVYINNGIVVSNLAYGQATEYIGVPAGDHSAVVTEAGSSNTLWEQSITASGTNPTTFIASSPTNLNFDTFADNLNPTSFGGTRLLLIHALADGPAVDVQLAEPVVLGGVEQAAGTALASSMAYGTSFGSFDIPALDYIVNVLPTGGTALQAIVSNLSLPLNAASSNFVIVYGTPTAPQALVLSAPLDAGAGDGLVRFIHGVVGAPHVDIVVNDTLIVPNLGTEAPSDHLALPAGDHSLELFVTGSEELIASGSLSVVAGSAQSIIALSADDGVELVALADNVSGASENTVLANVINAIPGSTGIDIVLEDGTALSEALAFGEASTTTSFAPSRQAPSFTVTIGGETGELSVDTQTLYGGVYYNIIALEGGLFSGPSLVFAPTVLAQGLASAPSQGVLNTATEAQPSEVVVEPALPPASTPAPVVAAQTSDVVTARVLLDPGANLQLRQYPNSEALSLGLAPSGTTLTVEGREGAPVALVEGQEAPPEAEDFVDPASLLEDERDDIVAEETWLRVVYPTPDGGSIVAWVNALYLDVRDADGQRQRLADLPLIGGNIPGESLNTSITPPQAQEPRVTVVVINLNPGVSLNIRRVPDRAGEVLARVPNGTVLDFIGFIDSSLIEAGEGADVVTPTPIAPEDAEWLFVEYQPAEGGTISGWVSTLYTRLEYNGRATDIEEMVLRNVFATVEQSRRGNISAGLPRAEVPTPDPLRDAFIGEVVLDPGANLQLRRSPSPQAESLNLIPSGTRVVVTARTELSDWLLVSFEGDSGWVSSQYIVLTFNGASATLEELPIDTSNIPTDAEEGSEEGEATEESSNG